VLAVALDIPELSCRQLDWKVTDSGHTYVSESTVYRILKREGLIKPAEIVGFKAGKEYRHKTKQPNELWATDCCHLKVIDWGWYYLVTVMDDHSRFILGWDLKADMAGDSLEDVVQQAVDFTGMTDVPLEDRTVLLSDNGAGYISQHVNRQGKWDTFGIKVSGHLRACSDTSKAVDYHSKGGVSHGATDHRPVLAG